MAVATPLVDKDRESFRTASVQFGWGVFIALSILWGWGVDKVRPDRFDLIGGAICLFGMAVIMYWPRS